MTTRLSKAIADLSRMTERQRDARATQLREAVYPEDKRHHQRMLSIYEDFMSAIGRHALEVEDEDRESARQKMADSHR